MGRFWKHCTGKECIHKNNCKLDTPIYKVMHHLLIKVYPLGGLIYMMHLCKPRKYSQDFMGWSIVHRLPSYIACHCIEHSRQL